MANNVFDQFDAPAESRPDRQPNPFDTFDAPKPAAAPKPRLTRSWGEAATDTAKAVGSGLGGVLQAGGDLYGLATGDFDNFASREGRGMREFYQDWQSDAIKERRADRSAKVDAADGVLAKAGTAAWETVTDPSLLVDLAAENVATLLPAGAAARIGAAAGGARAALRGATPAAAARQAGVLGTAAAIGTGAAQQGADVAGGVYDASLGADDATWARNEAYARRVEAGEDPDAVKRDLSLTAARLTFPAAAGISLASQAIPGGAAIERALAGGAARATLTRPGAMGRVIGAGRGALGEGFQEAIEEGGGQYAGNLARRGVIDDQVDTTEGVGESAGLGFAGALGLGGVAGATSQPRLAEPAPRAGSLQDAAETAQQQQPLLALPPPTIRVRPDGKAASEATIFNREQAREAAMVEFAAGRAALGLTPDVNAARTGHRAAAPNVTRPSLRYPTAAPGSLADVANDAAEAQPAAPALQQPSIQPPANLDELDAQAHAWQNQQMDNITDEGLARLVRSFFGKNLASVSPDQAARMTNQPLERVRALWPQIQSGETAQPRGPAAPAAAPAQTPERTLPPANLNPETGELLSVDAESWPAAAPHQQPRAIIERMVAARMAGEGRIPGVTALAEQLNLDKDTARALRKRVVDAVTAASNARISAPSAEPASPAPSEPSSSVAPEQLAGADAAPAAPAAQDPAPAARAATAGEEEAAASASPPVGDSSQDTPAAAEGAVYDPSEEVLDGDVTTPSGTPFTIEDAAQRVAARTEGGRVVPVDGGFVVRTPRAITRGNEASPPDSAPESGELAPPPPAADTRTGPDGALQLRRTDSQGRTYWVPAPAAPDSTREPAVPAARAEETATVTDATEPAPAAPTAAVVANGSLPAARAAQLQEGHRASGRDVTREQVQRQRDAVAREIETGESRAGGVTSKLRPAAIAARRARLERLDADLALWNTLREPQSEEAPPPAAESATQAPAASAPAVTGESALIAGQSRPAPAPAGRPKVRTVKGKRRYVEAHPDTLSAYFAPGNIVPSYGGQDRVLEFRPLANDGTSRWSVKVQAVTKDGTPRLEADGRPEAPRWHSTLPGQRELESVLGKAENQPRGRAPRAAAQPAAESAVAAAAAGAATSPTNGLPAPTEAQKEAGNYRVGKISINGLAISIENAAGTRRRPEWPKLKDAYGYFRGTVGKDKDHVDVFLTDRADDTSLPVFVVDQFVDGRFDEHKVVMGAANEAEARKVYQRNYTRGWKGLKAITEFTQEEFKAWVADPAKTAKRAALAKPAAAASAAAPARTDADTPAIADFGETLHGARKHLYADGYRTSMTAAMERDPATSTLSESWPAPDYAKLLEDGTDPWVVAFVRAARDEVPTKPAKGWRVKGWADQVSVLRSFSNGLLGGTISAERLRETLDHSDYTVLRRNLLGRVDLYQAVGHAVSLKGVNFSQRYFTIYRGQSNVTLWVADKQQKATAFSNWPRELATGATKEEAIEAFKGRLAELQAEDDAKKGRTPRAGTVRFNIYANRLTREISIGVKLGKGVVKVQGGFKTSAEARQHLAEHTAELETKLADLRNVPEVRRGNNSPRVGADHRNGGDVTPEQFGETFGFRGVQFGNYVEGPRRQRDLNEAYDGLMDLAGVLDLEPRALSLNGSLGLAFGARGKGGKRPASAHFEPDNVVINLTKNAGAGSLAHEWWHALDNYFASQRAGKKSFAFATDAATKPREAADPQGMRPEMMRAFQGIMEAIGRTGVGERSGRIDSMRSGKAYWGTGIEMSARSFESYVIAKLADQGAANDYLANVVSEEAFGGRDDYPYPNASEIPTVRGGFDDFFATIEAERTPEGSTRLFSQPAAGEGEGLSFDRALRLKAEITGRWGEDAPAVILVEDAEGFPASAKTDPAYRRAEGFYDGRPTVWLNVAALGSEQRFAQVLAHEALGHYGVERVVGAKDWDGIVDAIARHDRNGTGAPSVRAAIADVHRRYGELGRTDFAKEVIAVMAEQGARNGLLSRVVAAVRRWLRANMPSLASTWKDSDIVDLLGQADSFLHRGRTQGESRQMVAGMAFSRERSKTPGGLPEQASLPKGSRAETGASSATVPSDSEGVKPSLSSFLKGEPVAEVAGGAFARREGSTLVDQVAEFFASIGGSATNPQIGEVRLRKPGIQASISHGVGRSKAAAFRAVPDVIARGRVIDALVDESGRTANRHVIAAPVKIGGENYLMGVVVRQQGGDPANFYLHEVTLAPKKSPGDDPFKTEPRAEPVDIGGSAGAIGSLLRDAYAGNRDGRFSRAATSIRVDARGQRTMDMGGQTFVERSGTFYLADDKGQPRDFRPLSAATAAAQATGGEVLVNPPLEGERPAWSVVAPEIVVRGAEAARGRAPGFFSLPPDEAIAEIEEVMRAGVDAPLLERARAKLRDLAPKKVKDQLRPTWLGALTTRHLTELGADYFDNIRIYSDFLAEQGADRNKLQADGEEIVEAARKWAGKHQAEARALFDLMHDATIDGVDPAEEYKPLTFRYGNELREATPKNIKEALKAIREQMLGRGADNKIDKMAEAKLLRGMPARERRRKSRYAPLVQRWNNLSPEAQQIYRQFRDTYEDRSKQVEEGLVARINDTDAPATHKDKLIRTIRQQFETQRLQGVYFPLQRFGRFFVAAEKGETSTFLMFESLNQMERAVGDLKKRGFSITGQGLKAEGRAKDAPSGTFVAEVIETMRKAGVSDKTQDEIYQIYLQSLPELSMRKHSIHRKAVPGFDPDAVRAFAFNMHHGAHQIARLRHGHKLQNVLDLLKKQQDAARKEPGADTRKIVAGDAILEELGRRHEWINNPTDGQLTNLISSFGFTYYLGVSPAAALVNLTQTPLITYPYLASRYGATKAMNQLLAGMRDAIRTRGNIQKTLTDPDELRAHDVLQASGALDKTEAHNLAGIAESGLTGYNPAWAKAMTAIGWGFHKTEVVNREATGLAAYRLARADGASFDQAVKIAADAINDTHFDYTNANRARFMQSGTAKVLLMFRQYSLNMTWHLARMVWQATKGQDAEVKRIARRNLAGVLGMSALFSGTLGLPMMGVVTGVLNAVAASFGDDDEPWEAETEMRAFLSDMLGERAAETLLNGVANQVTGADIASRVGLDDLWIRDADRELDGRGAYYHLLEQAAGPMGGVLKNVLVGKHMMDEGHLYRGFETMLPKGLKDVLKAGRYATQGVNNLRGDALVENPSVYQALLQLNGFTPAQVSRQYDQNRNLKNYEQHILSRRQHLMDAYAMASRLGDRDGMQAATSKISAFNATNPEIAITGKSLRSSLRSRARYSAKAEAGIVLNQKIAARVRDAVGAG